MSLLLGAILTGGSLLGSALSSGGTEKVDVSKIYNTATADLEKAYSGILSEFNQGYDSAKIRAMSLYPQFKAEIADAYDIQKSKYFKELETNLSDQRDILKVDLEKSRAKGKEGLKSMLSRWGTSGARGAAQLREFETDFGGRADKALLGQALQGNQLLEGLVRQADLGRAQAQSQLAGQFAGVGAQAELRQPELALQLGQNYLGQLGQLGSQEAARAVGEGTRQAAQPSALQGLFNVGGQVGGAVLGKELGLKPEEVTPFRNPSVGASS